MTTFDLLRIVHISCGTVALASLWVPLFSKKGGAVHRRAGWVYVLAMMATALLACTLAAWRLAFTDDAARVTGSVFLAYLGVLSLSSSWMGVRVLRTKARLVASSSAVDLALPIALLLGGPALLLFGIERGSVLSIFFAALGTWLGARQVRAWRKVPTRGQWLVDHVVAMGTACIGTITAFAVTMSRYVTSGPASVVVWIAPTIIGIALITLWNRRRRA